MSRRDGYAHGVPSWIAGAHPDPEQAAAFYTDLFGWAADCRGDHAEPGPHPQDATFSVSRVVPA